MEMMFTRLYIYSDIWVSAGEKWNGMLRRNGRTTEETLTSTMKITKQMIWSHLEQVSTTGYIRHEQRRSNDLQWTCMKTGRSLQYFCRIKHR